MRYCQQELEADNLHCLKLLQEYRENPSATTYLHIYHNHFEDDCLEPVQVPWVMMKEAFVAYTTLKTAIASIAYQEKKNGGGSKSKNGSILNLNNSSRDLSSGDDRGSISSAAAEEMAMIDDSINRNELIRGILNVAVMVVVEKVEKELLRILDKYIVPRFIMGNEFIEYLEHEPLMFREAICDHHQANGDSSNGNQRPDQPSTSKGTTTTTTTTTTSNKIHPTPEDDFHPGDDISMVVDGT